MLFGSCPFDCTAMMPQEPGKETQISGSNSEQSFPIQKKKIYRLKTSGNLSNVLGSG